MKALLYSVLVTFLCSLIFRMEHWPFGGLLTMISLFLLFLFAVVNSVGKKQVFKIDILGGWTLYFWGMVIVFKLLFWPGASILLFPAVAISIAFLFFSRQKKWKEIAKPVLFTILFSLLFVFLPNHKLYYLINLNPLFNKEPKEIPSSAWETYSWLLYKSGNKEQSLQANKKALKSLEFNYNLLNRGNDVYEIEKQLILENRAAIESDNWTTFDW